MQHPSALSSHFGHQIITDMLIRSKYYFYFSPKTFITTVSQLQDTISNISSWITANLLSLNPSKTEFMLIGLPQNTYKISNLSLSLPLNHPITPTDSTRNLGFIFDSSLTFSEQISSLFSACNYHFRDLRRSRHTIDLKKHLLSLLLLYILN